MIGKMFMLVIIMFMLLRIMVLYGELVGMLIVPLVLETVLFSIISFRLELIQIGKKYQEEMYLLLD